MGKLSIAIPHRMVIYVTGLSILYIFSEATTNDSIKLLQLLSKTLFSVHFSIYHFFFSENNSDIS